MSVEPKDVPLQTLATVLAPDQFMSNPVDLLAYDAMPVWTRPYPMAWCFPAHQKILCVLCNGPIPTRYR